MKSTSAKEAKADIAEAAKNAETLLAKQTEEAIKVIAAAAAEALKVENNKNSGDHDLILEMKTELRIKFEQVFTQLDEVKNLTTKRIEDLETKKVDIGESYAVLYKADVDKAIEEGKKDSAANSKNITIIMTWGTAFVFFLAVVEFVINKFIQIPGPK